MDWLDKEAKREQFYKMVRLYIEEDPSAAAHISDYVQAGILASLDKAKERASKMEVLAIALGSKSKSMKKLAIEKLKELRGELCFNWDSFIAENDTSDKPLE